MNLSKKAERRMLIWRYDPFNRVLYFQWMDNKVVNIIPTMGVSGITKVKRRVVPEKVTMNSELVINSYTANMGRVD